MTRAILALLCTLAACIPGPVTPVDNATCEQACANMQHLGCPGSGGNEHASCAQACTDLQAEGFVPLHLDCVAGAHSCAQVDACADGAP
jgi:hypothetical protein